MAINFNPGDKVIINESFVNDTLASRTPTTERKALLEHIGRLGDSHLCVSRVYAFPLIKVTVISNLGSKHSPSLMFESEDDLNNSFTLIQKFTPKSHTVQAKNEDVKSIGEGQFVCLVGYEGSNPQTPIITAPDQKSLTTMPVFGITTGLIPPGSTGPVLVEGFYAGLPTTGTTLHPACYVGMEGEEIETIPGAVYRETAITVDPSQNGLIYLPKQPGGPYTCFEGRSFTGKGNNKINTDWGKSNSELKRLGKASYPDSKSMMPRRPNARHISNVVISQTKSQPNTKNATDYLWVWGQFLDHDIGLTEGANPSEYANIEVPAGDPHFPPGVIPFSRSDYNPATGTTDTREQITTQSSFIDASNVYGANDTRAAALRLNDGSGKLDSSPGNLLPKNTRLFANAPNGHDSLYYFAGDVRANEQLILLAMHTLWMREHNRLATEIKGNNSYLTGDQVYQAARRKVAALNQAITFNEFLPALLGPIPAYGGYDPTIDPSITNEFSAGLYRLGHSMVSEKIQRVDSNLVMIPEGWTSLRDAFFRPDRLLEGGGIEPLLRGAATQICQDIDLGVVDELRNFLFGNPGAGGLDLAALNIQRGRDHGLPSYNDTRIALGLSPKRSYSQISSDSAVVSKLTSVYSTINEIDLWVGMLAEDHVEGAMVGETLKTGLLKQFLALRDGDRFWYENVFAGSLLDEINTTTLSDVIKRNTSIGAELQDNVFYLS
jgi:hypothetical protein